MTMPVAARFYHYGSTFRSDRSFLLTSQSDAIPSSSFRWKSNGGRNNLSFKRQARFLQTMLRMSSPETSPEGEANRNLDYLRSKKTIPDASPPSSKDIDLLHQFFDRSNKMVVLTGAGMSTECGIPDYRSPNGAYSTGFKPITYQEFLNSRKARKRYWVGSYAGWRRFSPTRPGAGHVALSSLEKAGRIDFMITQNVDRLHHRAGSDPLELHGTLYTVGCIGCGYSFCRRSFQDQLKDLNPKWAATIDSLIDSPGLDQNSGMRMRPDGDVDIDENFWEDEDFHIPTCPKCDGLLKPQVVFFGENIPKDRADRSMEAAKSCDALLVIGSSLMTESAFRLVRAARENGAATAIINIGPTRADNIVPLKIRARCGEIISRMLYTGSLSVPAVQL